MVNIMQGQSDKIASNERLVDFFNRKDYDGKLYIGYPILYSGGDNIVLDAIWISHNGIIVFDIVEGASVENRESYRDELYNKVEAILKQHKRLSSGRSLIVKHEVITYAPACSNIDGLEFTANDNNLQTIIDNTINKWSKYGKETYEIVISIIQSIVKLKITTDRVIKQENSKGYIVNKLEETIANLDGQQERAIIEYKDGIQRIRGLAGSGKTIVLALKAAYLHSMNPHWDIAITFNTRSLKNQFKDLIELFCIQRMGRKPDEEKIKIIHAWGNSKISGLYYDFCKDNNVVYSDYGTAKGMAFNSGKQPFDYICEEAINNTKNINILEKYDIILVDEAQDLSASFLKLCYLTLRGENKRLIYAYDELQKLYEGSSLPNPKEIFTDSIKYDDIILEKCYRNPKQALATAHALGFGIYRDGGLVQFFDEPKLWKDLGYNNTGELYAGNNISLTRDENPVHKLIEQHTNNSDIVKFIECSNKEDQAKRVAESIYNNIYKDELSFKDIIVINPLALTTKSEVAAIRWLLQRNGIRSHIAGDLDKDVFFIKDSITFTGINRAKGNEVPMVYIINAQDCYAGEDPRFPNRGLQERRNILFTAITRSKAWVRVYGSGNSMKLLTEEYNKVVANEYSLKFTYPSQEEIEKINLISRDLSDSEKETLSKDIDALSNILQIIDKINNGKAIIDDYPEDMRFIINSVLNNGNK